MSAFEDEPTPVEMLPALTRDPADAQLDLVLTEVRALASRVVQLEIRGDRLAERLAAAEQAARDAKVLEAHRLRLAQRTAK